MADGTGKVWFITGATSGFGQSLALELVKRGDCVAATARDAARLDPALKEGDRVLPLTLEVADEDQCRQAVDRIHEKFGRIDVLVNNAGHSMIGAVEEISDAEARLVFDSNVFGLLNVTRAVLPAMRKARSGFIVNIGSVGGISAQQGSGIYGATKFAVEGISEGLYHELKPLGIGVTVVEPGPFRTEFSGRSLLEAKVVLDDYDSTAGVWRRELRGKHGKQQGDPDKAARVIIQAVESPKPPLHLVVGGPAIARAEKKLSDMFEEIESWREASLATDYD